MLTGFTHVIETTFYLSKKGQMAAALTDYSSAVEHTVKLPPIPELMEMAMIDVEGRMYIDEGSNEFEYTVVRDKTKMPSPREYVNGSELIEDSCVLRNQDYKYRGYPFCIKASYPTVLHFWDYIPSDDELIEYLKEQSKRLKAKRAAAEEELEIKQTQWEKEEKEEKEKREKREKEKEQWCEKYGDDRLKNAIGAGYEVQHEYVTQRVALEYPGFVVDFENNARWRKRILPSKEAMDFANKLNKNGVSARVVWLTNPVDYTLGALIDLRIPFHCHEAVLIQDYLGRYNIFHDI